MCWARIDVQVGLFSSLDKAHGLYSVLGLTPPTMLWLYDSSLLSNYYFAKKKKKEKKSKIKWNDQIIYGLLQKLGF